MTDEEFEKEFDALCVTEGVVRTGVFVSEALKGKCMIALDEAEKTPVIRVCGTWMHVAAMNHTKDVVHAAALESGLDELPPVNGERDMYGMVMRTGEFVRAATRKDP